MSTLPGGALPARAKPGARTGASPAPKRPKPVPNLRSAPLGHLASGQVQAAQAQFVGTVLAGPAPAQAADTAERAAAELLGGWARLGGAEPLRRADLHKVLVKGLPTAALVRLVGGMQSLRLDELAVALGVSDRTLRRYVDEPRGTLSIDMGSRLWSLALLLAKATAAVGSRADAERWLIEPAWGLDDERPLDLLRTEPGRALVDEFLERLLHGVYN